MKLLNKIMLSATLFAGIFNVDLNSMIKGDQLYYRGERVAVVTADMLDAFGLKIIPQKKFKGYGLSGSGDVLFRVKNARGQYVSVTDILAIIEQTAVRQIEVAATPEAVIEVAVPAIEAVGRTLNIAGVDNVLSSGEESSGSESLGGEVYLDDDSTVDSSDTEEVSTQDVETAIQTVFAINNAAQNAVSRINRGARRTLDIANRVLYVSLTTIISLVIISTKYSLRANPYAAAVIILVDLGAIGYDVIENFIGWDKFRAFLGFALTQTEDSELQEAASRVIGNLEAMRQD